MGIPNYFSYIIKNYNQIIKNKNSFTNVHNFLLDANSIIYDAVIYLQNNDINVDTLSIINQTIKKIEEYIAIINPRNITYITFDGVAPLAKIKQQRDRRYKSIILGKKGKTIKRIRERSQNQLNNILNCKVHLYLQVVIKNEK